MLKVIGSSVCLMTGWFMEVLHFIHKFRTYILAASSNFLNKHLEVSRIIEKMSNKTGGKEKEGRKELTILILFPLAYRKVKKMISYQFYR